MTDRQQYDRYNGNYKYESFNKNSFDTNLIDTDTSKKIPLSLSHEPNIKYSKRIDYIVITSKDRDLQNYPTPSKYVINLPREFKNITTIEIVAGIIPDKNNVLQEPYLLLKIDELDEIITSNDTVMCNSFAILHLAKPVYPGAFIQVDKKTFEHVVLRYHTPKASLSKLTISVTDLYGTPFNFGTDSTTTPLKELQNMFVLRITTLEKDRDLLSQRNVY